MPIERGLCPTLTAEEARRLLGEELLHIDDDVVVHLLGCLYCRMIPTDSEARAIARTWDPRDTTCSLCGKRLKIRRLLSGWWQLCRVLIQSRPV